jgi:hypothetical protein
MTSYLNSVLRQFQYYENLGMRTMEQLSTEALIREPAEGVNSIAVIVKHLHGNMLSRWTDFMTSDGEKETRNRDGEFEHTLASRDEIYKTWNEGWKVLFGSLEELNNDDLERVVYIRNQGHSVIEAINRQLCHYAYHVGQIVFIGKIFKGEDWVSLSIPKNQSKDYNQEKFSREKNRIHFTDDEIK